MTMVDGCRCVRVGHAIAQLPVRCGLVAALVPLDAALRKKLCTIEEVAAAVREICGESSPSGKRLLQLADAQCESVGETRTRALLRDLGYASRSQISIYDRGSFVARVDFLIGKRVVVEFDGLMKYDGADGKGALAREKRREDLLRALGYIVVRLIWADLETPQRVADVLRRARAQAERSAS